MSLTVSSTAADLTLRKMSSKSLASHIRATVSSLFRRSEDLEARSLNLSEPWNFGSTHGCVSPSTRNQMLSFTSHVSRETGFTGVTGVSKSSLFDFIEEGSIYSKNQSLDNMSNSPQTTRSAVSTRNLRNTNQIESISEERASNFCIHAEDGKRREREMSELSDATLCRRIELSVKRFEQKKSSRTSASTKRKLQSVGETEVSTPSQMDEHEMTRFFAKSMSNASDSNSTYLKQLEASVWDYISGSHAGARESENKGDMSHSDMSPAAAVLMMKMRNPSIARSTAVTEEVALQPTALVKKYDQDHQRQYITNGSAKHHLDECNACGFFYKGKCVSGFDCEYCHLCTKADVRRKKKKKQGDAGVGMTFGAISSENTEITETTRDTVRME